MPASLIDSDSLLAVDVGSVTTRATLFDVVEGHYRFIATGQAPSTTGAPFKDISEGARQAITNLQTVTGRKFLGEDRRLIQPVTDGNGVDAFVATFSAGPAIKTVIVGLLSEVSVESTQRLARTTYARVVDTIGMNDPRRPDQQIDAILRLRPDLVLIAGGTDAGATRSVERLIETVGLACYLTPEGKRPAVLFAGNTKMADKVKSSLEHLVPSLFVSPNLRPSLEVENLQPAQHTLAEVVTQVRRGQVGGVDELNAWAGNTLMPTAYAEGRIIRFLSQVYDTNKGLLGVDLGASAATVAAAFGNQLVMGVYPQLGLGESLSSLLRYVTLEDVAKWIHLDLPAEQVRDYLFQKSLYPSTLPATPEDLAIEQAVARQSLFVALNSAAKDFPRGIRRAAPGLMPYFEPILAAGSVITRAPTLGQSLMILLDGIQPIGVTTLILDQNNLLPALGAAASRNSILPIQVLESGAFLGLATVVAPYVNARPGTVVLEARLLHENGTETRLEVKQGALEILPLPAGEAGRLYLEPQHHAELGVSASRLKNEGIPVSGTAMGVVFDARGRPLPLPSDPARRSELIKKWLWTVGG